MMKINIDFFVHLNLEKMTVIASNETKLIYIYGNVLKKEIVRIFVNKSLPVFPNHISSDQVM